MKIFTTYYSNLRNVNFTNDDVVIVSISRTYPDFVKPTIHYTDVAPTPYMIGTFKKEFKTNKKLAIKHYVDDYLKVLKLNKFDANNFLKEYSEKYKDKLVLLCCYEKPESFCHRHLLSSYIRKFTGYNIHELKTTKEEIFKQVLTTNNYVYERIME